MQLFIAIILAAAAFQSMARMALLPRKWTLLLAMLVAAVPPLSQRHLTELSMADMMRSCCHPGAFGYPVRLFAFGGPHGRNTFSTMEIRGLSTVRLASFCRPISSNAVLQPFSGHAVPHDHMDVERCALRHCPACRRTATSCHSA